MCKMDPWKRITQTIPVRALVEASAGTGKTYTIEQCVLEFVSRGVKISGILLVTFTEKAAMELRARVREKLLQEAAGKSSDPERLRNLKKAAADFDSAVVTTLHGFAQRALSWFSLYTPYPYEQEVRALDEILPDVVRRLARGPWLCGEATSAALQIMLEETENDFDAAIEILRSCVEMPLPLRFSGFPEAMAHLSERSRNWEDVFSAVFSASKMKNGDVDAWRERLALFFAKMESGNWISAVGAWRGVHSKTRAAFLAKCKNALEKIPASQADFLQEWIDCMQQADKTAKSKLHMACLVLVPKLRAALGEEKRRLFAMTYGDMLERLNDALENPETGPLLAAQLQKRFPVGIVDEFQDTDELQWNILTRVFLDNPAGSLVVVGDPKQAIYRFRGADIRTYQQAVRELSARNALHENLDWNFRCTPQMVSAVNYFFGGDGPASFFRMQDVVYDHDLACGKPGLRLTPSRAPFLFLGQRYCPHISQNRWRFLLAGQIAQEIRQILHGGFQMEEPAGNDSGTVVRPIDYRDIFILVPKHHEGRIVAGELRNAGIPFAFYKRQTLFDGMEARSIADVLRAVLDPAKPAVRHKALVTPFFGLDPREIAHAGIVPTGHPAMSFLLSLHEDVRQGQNARMLQRLELESGLYRRLFSFASTRRDAINYERLFAILRHLAFTRLWTMPRILDALESWKSEDGIDPEIADLAMEVTDPQENAVRILTMHNAKGLEAPIVFLYGGFSGPVSPSVKMYHSPEENQRVLFAGKLEGNELEQYKIEEDGDAERLMYVAMTRAKALCCVQSIAKAEMAPAHDGVREDDADAETAGDASREDERSEGEPAAPEENRSAAGMEEDDGRKKGEKSFFRGVISTVLRRMKEMKPQPEFFEERVDRVLCSRCRETLPSWDFSPPQTGDAPALPELEPWQEPTLAWMQWMGRQRALFSYSSLKKRGVETETEKQEPVWDLLPDVPEGEPPPGTKTGLAVHALCETADIAELQRHPEADSWLGVPGREEAIRKVLRGFSLPGDLWRRFGEMVHAAYRTTVDTGDGRLFLLCEASSIAREAEFRIPWDDALQNRLSEVFSHVPRETGSLMGYFDALVELDGKLWLVDWKTDLLPDYSTESVYAHVCSHYALQALVYEEALLRMRPAVPYGGFLYVFVRGLTATSGMAVLPPGWKPPEKIL